MGLGDTPSGRSLPWTPPQCGDPGVAVQVYVAAFAVSAYASTFYRAGSKPFNPVLGETYECVRPDRGFRFISEQVLRGWGGRGRRGGARGAATPPLSSPRSAITPPSPLATPSPTTSSSGKVGAGLRGPRMGSQSGPDPHLPPSPRHEVEEQILGQILGDRPGGHRQRPPAQVSTHPPLTPPPPALCSRPPQPEPAVGRSGDHFEWNKVTTCIHNVLSGPRWIEHYGEVLIRNTRDASYHCKITFCKVRPAHRVATPPSAQAPPTRRCSMLCSLSGPAPFCPAPIQAPPLRPSPQPITDRRLPHSFPTRAAPFVNGPTSPRGPAL